MLILLPPSEGKTAPPAGPPLDLAALTYPELAPARQEVIDALISASAGGPAAISAPPSTAAEVAANLQLWQAPTAPAAQVYTGVLFAAAGLADLSGTAAERAGAHVRIASTVFGFVRPDDPIPAYRLPPAARLPEVGAPLAHLAGPVRQVLGAELGASPGVVLDCRSGPYLRLWKPDTDRVSVRVVEIRAGRPVVVSHWAKHHRGVLTRHLLTRVQELPSTPQGVRDATAELLGREYADVTLTRSGGGAYVLELTVTPQPG